MRTRSRLAMPLRSAPVTKHHKKDRFTAVFFVPLCALTMCIWTACTQPTNQTVPYQDAQTEWREGDIVFRRGTGLESHVVTTRSAAVYSHVGLLHYDSLNSEWQVVHAVPAEDEPEYLKAEPVSVFFSPERAEKGAWLRVDCSDSVAQAAVQYALGKVAQHVLFDNDYLLEDTTQIYCTELVWRAYLTQSIDVSGAQRQTVPTLFSKEGEAIFPNDIEKSATTLFINHLN